MVINLITLLTDSTHEIYHAYPWIPFHITDWLPSFLDTSLLFPTHGIEHFLQCPPFVLLSLPTHCFLGVFFLLQWPCPRLLLLWSVFGLAAHDDYVVVIRLSFHHRDVTVRASQTTQQSPIFHDNSFSINNTDKALSRLGSSVARKSQILLAS